MKVRLITKLHSTKVKKRVANKTKPQGPGSKNLQREKKYDEKEKGKNN